MFEAIDIGHVAVLPAAVVSAIVVLVIRHPHPARAELVVSRLVNRLGPTCAHDAPDAAPARIAGPAPHRRVADRAACAVDPDALGDLLPVACGNLLHRRRSRLTRAAEID